jgi:ABC-type polysaccharide/polyol phosphate export permease
MIKELIKYRDLLYMLTFRDIRIRYKQAAMGFMWAIFMPVVAVTAGLFVKKAIALLSGRDLDMIAIVSVSVKILPWTFFANSLTFAVPSLVGNSHLVTKIYFPKAVLPLAAILACFFDFAISGIALGLLLIIFNFGISIYI